MSRKSSKSVSIPISDQSAWEALSGMYILKQISNKYFKFAMLAIISMVLSSCLQGQLSLPGQNQVDNGTSLLSSLPPANGEIIGNGKVRVALLLPLTAPGNAGKIGAELKNAAKLAMRDFGQNTIQLVIKNTAGQAATAQSAASEAIKERASVLIGPLFSGSVSAASSVTLPVNISMIAFSSDPRRARRGVYLMSFSPQADIRRSINFAISQGKTKFAVLLPNGAYGTLVETTLRKVLNQNRAQLTVLQKYDHSNASIEAAVQGVAETAKSADVIYIPDGGKVPGAILSELNKAGVNTAAKMVLGSGQWESSNLSAPILSRAIFAGRDKSQFPNFAKRYNAAYGAVPSSTAGLAYDAVSMVAGLARRGGGNPFRFANIESRNGYSGVNGIFRFQSNGKADRGLAIYQVQSGKAQIVSRAPTTFGPGS